MNDFDLKKYLTENKLTAASKVLNEEQVDMEGKKCTKCKKGTYKETSQMDDLEGVLHCDRCNDETERYVNTQ